MQTDIKLVSYGASDVGRRRKHNEDFFLIIPEVGLYGVADGVGGHQAGDLASRMVLEGLHHRLLSRPDLFGKKARQTPIDERRKRETKLFLDRAIQAISYQIFALAQQRGSDFRMGSTVTALIDLGEIATVVHVGDSRCYLLRKGIIYQLTEDHSLIAEQLKMGLISPEEAAKSRHKNVITRAVGMAERLPVDIFFVDLVPNDRFLLCTDGFYNYLRPGELEKILAEKDLTNIPEQCIELANQRGGRDNITAIALEVESVSETKVSGTFKSVVNDSITLLQHSPLFRGMTYPEALKLLSLTNSEIFKQGEIIIREGAPPKQLFIIKSGEIAIYHRGELIARLGRGDYFGEMGIFDGAPYSATAVAERPTECLKIEGKEFLRLIRQAPDIGYKIQYNLILELIRRLRRTSSALAWTRSEWRKSAEADFTPSPGSIEITLNEEKK